MKSEKNACRIEALWRDLKGSVVQAPAWLELALCYQTQGLSWHSSYAARQAKRLDADLLTRLNAAALVLESTLEASDALLGRAVLPNAQALADPLEAWLRQAPGDWLSCLYLARLREMQVSQLPASERADKGGAAALLDRAGLLEPIAGESLHWMGVWRLNAGDGTRAIAAFSQLLDIRPVRFSSMMYLGEALLQVGNVMAAEKAFMRASGSENADFLQSLAGRLYGNNYWQEAIAVLQKALQFRPDHVPFLLALAKIQSEVYALADCRENLQRIKRLAPENVEGKLLAASLQGRMGDAKDHLNLMQEAYRQGGDPLSRLVSSVAMSLLYQDDLSAEEVADQHVGLCAPIEAATQEPQHFFTNELTVSKRLRVGYVTGDLHRQHPVNVFMLPILLQQQTQDVDIHVYYTGGMHDEYTLRSKACASRWVEASKLDDLALKNVIMADEVDILVDLAGHTSTHRLGIFAMRAAPIQATFLGYPHSTGLSTMDWLIGDAVVAPVEHGHLFSERLAQLPGSVFCWAPVDSYPLPPARPAAAAIVFGSFNNAMKLSRRTINLWAQILSQVAGSELLLKAPSLRDPLVRERYYALFEARGIGRERLILRGPSGLAAMMQEYGDMDIALDPTPYNGGTTTLQALWMGVPVVTLLGDNFVGRMGASFMQTLGESCWIGGDDDAYVAAAVHLAKDCVRLRAGRPGLREKMARSRLCDIDSYVSDFTDLLHAMWRDYCQKTELRVLTLANKIIL